VKLQEQELLDVVDERDVVIKRGVAREDIHARRLLHRSVIVFVLNSKGQIFVQERSPAKDVYPGLLLASCSGHVLSGESYKEAAIRELREELGIEVGPRALDRVCDFNCITPEEQEMTVLFVLENYDKPINIDRQEIISGKFVSVQELKNQTKLEPKKFTPPFLRAFGLWWKRVSS